MILDFHVHPFFEEAIKDKRAIHCIREIYGYRSTLHPVETYLMQMKIAKIDKAVLLPLNSEYYHKCALPSNEIVAKLVDEYSDKFIGFASVDPKNPEKAVKDLEKAINDLGLKGLKLNPYFQDFNPADKRIYPIYEKAQELGIPIVFHTGMIYSKHGLLKHTYPLIFDEIAQKFPDLKIILAHFGWPWVKEAAILAVRHKNVYVDIADCFSGTPYEHLKHVLTEAIPKRIVERFISDKILFGSNFPKIEADKMIRGLLRVNLRDEIRRKILGENAARVFKL